jgi:VanZ family protein
MKIHLSWARLIKNLECINPYKRYFNEFFMIIKFFEENSWLPILISVILAGFIFYVSSIESFSVSGGGGEWVADAYHFGVFFFFTALLLLGLVRGKYLSILVPVIIFSLFYAILDEYHQLFVPGRYASFGDVLLDSAGIFLASLIYIAILYYRD